MSYQRKATFRNAICTQPRHKRAAGFSLLELLIAMTITLLVMTAASTLLTTSLRTRTRENRRSEALSDAQRAISLMSREIGNSGYGLIDNGIVVNDSGQTAVRIRANINSIGEQPLPPGPPLATDDADEDVTYVYQAANEAIVRYDRNAGVNTVLARPVNLFRVRYLDSADVETAIPNAVKIRLTVLITLPASDSQPASQMQLTSDVALRNAPEVLGRY
ncbi:MAG TPA: prepilin-type N-terminal cleavage/methylation domain-containing protein [Pyrinomonadaceae bacterium]|jgi:prepilin-type N-terminal cleavage/methylation domain-containing protein